MYMYSWYFFLWLAIHMTYLDGIILRLFFNLFDKSVEQKTWPAGANLGLEKLPLFYIVMVHTTVGIL